MNDKRNPRRVSASFLDPRLRAKLPASLRDKEPLEPLFNTQSDPLYAAGREAMAQTEAQRRENQTNGGNNRKTDKPKPTLKPRGGPAPGGTRNGSAWVREEYRTRIRQLEYDEISNARHSARENKSQTRTRQ